MGPRSIAGALVLSSHRLRPTPRHLLLPKAGTSYSLLCNPGVRVAVFLAPTRHLLGPFVSPRPKSGACFSLGPGMCYGLVCSRALLNGAVSWVRLGGTSGGLLAASAYVHTTHLFTASLCCLTACLLVPATCVRVSSALRVLCAACVHALRCVVFAWCLVCCVWAVRACVMRVWLPAACLVCCVP